MGENPLAMNNNTALDLFRARDQSLQSAIRLATKKKTIFNRILRGREREGGKGTVNSL